MALCEEYMKRHGIKIPYIKRVTNATLMFRSDKSFWKILTINWADPQSHPGYYVVRLYNPLHEGFKQGRYLETVSEKGEIYVDQYETHITNILCGCHSLPTDRAQVIKAAWEISLKIFDSMLAKKVGANHNLFLSDLNAEQLEAFIAQMTNSVPDFGQFWYHNMISHIDGYSYSLAEFANGMLTN